MSTWTAVVIAFVLWFAITTYMNMQLAKVHAKLDRMHDQFYGLREYLYEIDPQFDDERELLREGYSEDFFDAGFANMDHADLIKRKKEEGYRTLHALFVDGGFRAPNR